MESTILQTRLMQLSRPHPQRMSVNSVHYLGPGECKFAKLTAARLQRWAVHLSAYKYDILYKPSLEHRNVDELSCLPLPTGSSQPDHVAQFFNIGQIQSLPVTVADVQKDTRSDKVLSKVYQYNQNGWPTSISKDLQP